MSIHLDFDLTGLDTLQRRLESELDGLARNAVIATGKVVKARAKQGPFKDHTRQLRSTISDRYVGKRGAYHMVIVKAPMKYASFVEEGTAAHDIWPKAIHGLKGPVREGQTRRASGRGPHEHIVGRGIALRWKDAGGGGEHFARMVHHPGSKAYAFMRPAADYGQQYIRDFIQRGFAGIATRMESYA